MLNAQVKSYTRVSRSIQFEFTHVYIFLPSTVLFNSLKDTVLLARLSYFTGIHIILVGKYSSILLSKTLFEVKTLYVNIMFIFMPIKIRNADIHERVSPLLPDHF